MDVREVTLDSLRRSVGIVLQDVFAFSATIRDNIAYGVDEASMDDVVRAAKAAQLHGFIEGLPDGYDTWVGERGVTPFRRSEAEACHRPHAPAGRSHPGPGRLHIQRRRCYRARRYTRRWRT